MKNAPQMNGARPFMHVYVISPAAPLFLVHPSLPALRAVLIPAGFSARTAGSVMTRRYKEVGRVKRLSALSIRTRTRGVGTILQAVCVVEHKPLTRFNESIESGMRLLCNSGEKGARSERRSEALIGREVRGSALTSASL
jgi:hypothetical protein